MAERSDSPSPVVEAMYAREMWPWALLGVACGLVEGGTVAVLVKKGFTGLVAPHVVDFAVATVSGAPALANISSFAWANLAHGRARVGVLAGLQAAFAVAVGLVVLAPVAAGGLALTLCAVVVARVLWAGILTVRAAVWSANYPRHVMARVTSRIVMLSSLGIALVALLAGWILDVQPRLARWLYLFAALCGLLAAFLYRSVRVRREYQLLAAEAEVGVADSAFSLRVFRQILREDASFRSYMFWMSLYGSGNLMMTAQLVVLFTDRLQLGSMRQILLLTVVPLLLMPLFLPAWARLFDRGHIIEYRSRQCWALVAAIMLLTLGVWLKWQALLWPGALLIGVSYAGANLGWNLGHNDFASPGRAQHYMGVHVTLTGVRGLIAPPVGMACYELLVWRWPGAGAVSMLLPLGLVTAGALGFVRMRNEVRAAAART
ncbi:MAG: MFS transporter [Proteobacteria bacterium]|nr:MFS transporter [Pseudomonadota bacterium]